MTLGYCIVCNRLLAIVPRERKHPGSESRQRNWYPIVHDANDGTPCPGEKKRL